MGNRLTSADVTGTWNYNLNNELLGYVDVESICMRIMKCLLRIFVTVWILLLLIYECTATNFANLAALREISYFLRTLSISSTCVPMQQAFHPA